MESPGEWLEKALNDIYMEMETGVGLDSDMISGLVSYCELASPQDAKEYLDNIIPEELGRSVIKEYLSRRGYKDPSSSANLQTSHLQAYVKPPADGSLPSSGVRKPTRTPTDNSYSVTRGSNNDKVVKDSATGQKNVQSKNQTNSKKKKTGKPISLAEMAKGSIVFQQGKPCSCQARRHKLVSNCLSCGKIVCEQEGEGPCHFCGALVLREGSTYAGLDGSVLAPSSEADVAAEAYAKRLVDYDRNSAARTTVIDDQSDYYDDGNSWLSTEEKELLRKKEEERINAEEEKRKKVLVSFDLVGRKVLLNRDELGEMELGNSLLRPADHNEVNRIKPNPTVKIQPIFIDPGPKDKTTKPKSKALRKGLNKGLCLEISGRVQHDTSELKNFGIQDGNIYVDGVSRQEDDAECSRY